MIHQFFLGKFRTKVRPATGAVRAQSKVQGRPAITKVATGSITARSRVQGTFGQFPCPWYPLNEFETGPIDQTVPTEDPVLIVDVANRLSEREIEIRLDLMNDNTLDALFSYWNNGGGKFDPFSVQLPTEDSPRRYVFANDLSVRHINAKMRGTLIRLIDVEATIL